VDNIQLEHGTAQRPVVISDFHTRREISAEGFEASFHVRCNSRVYTFVPAESVPDIK
jgi:hypothetical protein